MSDQQDETIRVTKNKVSCESGGHPKVYLTLSAQGKATCPYCGRSFEKATTQRT